MLNKIKIMLMVLLLMVIPSISLVNVKAADENPYVISESSNIENDLSYLGFSSYVNDNVLEVITFSLGLNKNNNLSLFAYFYSRNDLSLNDITLSCTSLTEGVGSFSDTYGFVSRKDNIYKFVYKKSNTINSLYSLISKNTSYEFNIDKLIIGSNTFTEVNGGYFEQRFYIERMKTSDGVYSYYVKSINNVSVVVDADLGVRRLEDEKNFFNSVLFSDEVRDLFYICFDVYLNDKKVLYDFYQVDLSYDVEYVKYVQNLSDWDNPLHISLSKEVLETVHYEESITSKDTVLSFKKYNWFGKEFAFLKDVSVSFNTLSTMDYAKNKGYVNDFDSDKSYVLFFGNVEEGYKYTKGTVYSDFNCKYTFNSDPGFASYGICKHIDVYEYRPSNLEFITLYYRVNGFEYSLEVDETYIKSLGVSGSGPGSSVDTSGGLMDMILSALKEFFGPLIDAFNAFLEFLGVFKWLILGFLIILVVGILWNPLTFIFKMIWIGIKFLVIFITLPFRLIGKLFKKVFKKSEYSNKVKKYEDKGGW